MLKLSRRLDGSSACCGTTAAATDDRSRIPVPSPWSGQVDDLVELLAGRRAVLIGHSYGGDVALATADRHPDLVAGVAVYETPLSWVPWWPNTTAGSIAVAEQRDTQAGRRAVHATDPRRPDGGRLFPSAVKQTRRAEGVALVDELSDLRDNQPWIAEHITMPVITAYGSLASPHHRRGMTHAAALLELSGRRVARLSARCAVEPPGSVPGGDRRSVAAGSRRALHRFAEQRCLRNGQRRDLDVGAEERAA